VSAIYALFTSPDAAQRAVNMLQSAGVGDDRITIVTGEPYEEYDFAHRDKATWMWYIAAAGGFVGLATATWLARLTELAWPLPTGNMPIVAWWPNLIIMFELTMLGGILAAVATLLVTAKLPSKRTGLYDPAVMDGQILVGVEGPSDASAVERALAGGELRRV
jgi:molybdopterin-containing oxidoreductase family membrane subunit